MKGKYFLNNLQSCCRILTHSFAYLKIAKYCIKGKQFKLDVHRIAETLVLLNMYTEFLFKNVEICNICEAISLRTKTKSWVSITPKCTENT